MIKHGLCNRGYAVRGCSGSFVFLCDEAKGAREVERLTLTFSSFSKCDLNLSLMRNTPTHSHVCQSAELSCTSNHPRFPLVGAEDFLYLGTRISIVRRHPGSRQPCRSSPPRPPRSAPSRPRAADPPRASPPLAAHDRTYVSTRTKAAMTKSWILSRGWC